MSDPLLVLLLTIGLSVLIGFVGWSWSRRRSSNRHLVRAVGLIILLVGLYMTGLSELLVVAIRGLIDWFAIRTLDTPMWIGIGACLLGPLMYLAGGRIRVPGQDAGVAPGQVSSQSENDQPVIQAVPPAPAYRPPAPEEEPTLVIPADTQVATPDDQVTAILRKHGLE